MASDRAAPAETSLEELFARLDDADDSETGFLDLILERAERRDPELPELLRAGALPHALDTEIIGVLRGPETDLEGDRRLLEMLSEYRFVLPRPDGALVYHDNTRDALLADWKSTEEKRAYFVDLNLALASFHEGKYEQRLASDRRLAEVSGLIARANPERLQRLTNVVESNMAASLLEALYHHLLANPRDGFEFFQTAFFDLETDSRMGICQSMISFARDFLHRLPPTESEPTLLAWLEYFDTRVARGMPGSDTAEVEKLLRRLLDSEELPLDLHTWALEDLAGVYENQLKLDAAVRTRLELAEQRTGIDVYNDPLRHNGLASLYWWLGDYPAAVQQYKLAIDKVDKVEGTRSDMGVISRLDLAGVLSELGEWDEAFEAGIEALYRARTSFPENRTLQYQVASRLAGLLAAFDVRASDCASTEAIELIDARSGQRAGALISRIDLLLDNGRVRTAAAWLKRLEGELDDDDESNQDLELRRAMLLQRQGRERQANDVYSSLLQGIAGQPGADLVEIAALFYRGGNHSTLGNLDEAVSDLTKAIDRWNSAGSPIQAANSKILLADAQSRAGNLDAAMSILESAEQSLGAQALQSGVPLHITYGDNCERAGDWPAAQDHYERALEGVTASRDLETQAALLRKLASVHSERSRWSVEARYHRRASLAAEQLAHADAYNDTGRERESEQENAKGLRSFCAVEDRETALDQARQLFRSARDLDPDNIWILLNLSFTHAAQHDWQGATETLERVLDLSPAPLRTARLYECLRDYVLKYGHRLVARGDPRRAAAAIGTALDRLSTELASAELARVRALHSAALALAGDTAAARSAFAAAAFVDKPEERASERGRLMAESMAPLIRAPGDHWVIDSMLKDVEEDQGTSVALRDQTTEARAALGTRLDDLLGLLPAVSPEMPVTTPIVVEVGDALVPIVDSRLDEGVFLFELIPAMRDRILDTTGVLVPGVRMRGNPALAPDAYTVQIDEVPAAAGSAPFGPSFVVVRPEEMADTTEAEFTEPHPLTGDPGMWAIDRRTDPPADGESALTTAQYLLHGIERVVRAYLPRFLGPEEVHGMVDTWSAQDTELVASVFPDADAVVRLTWILQGLLDEGIPVTDWRAIVTAIRDEGGISAPTRTLRRAARNALGAAVAVRTRGRRILEVPKEFQTALLDGAAHGEATGSGHDPEDEFLRWLRTSIGESRAAIALVVETEDAREAVASLARTEGDTIITLSDGELARA